MKLLLQILWGWSVLANGAVGIQVETIQTNNQNIKLMKFNYNNPAFLQVAGNARKAKDYFYIRSLADANEVTFEDTKLGAFADNIEYSLDGNSWSQLSADDVITLNSGESILFRNPNNTVYNLSMGTNIVYTSDEYEVGGNIVQLFYPGVKLPEMAFMEAFDEDELIISASDLKLPATVLAESCYSSMFYGCTGLTAAPELPATALAKSCYSLMFSRCTGLTAAPELPATVLAESCYSEMFGGCTGLTEITCLASSGIENATSNWLSNVAASGTFTKAADMEDWPTGSSGIPTGWTVQDYVG